MADQTNIGAEGAPAAEPQNTEENRIPQARFNEVNSALKIALAELESLKRERHQQEETRLAEEKRWEELAGKYKADLDKLSGYEDQVKDVETTLNAVLEAQLTELSDDARAMIDDLPLSAQQKLDYLAKNRHRLIRPTAPDMDAGARGDGTKTTRKLTPGEQTAARAAKMSEAAYLEALQKMERAAAQAAGVSFKEHPK